MVGDGDGVLEVGGAARRRAVTTVQPSSSTSVSARAGVHHRLDREHVALLEPRARARAARSSGPAGPRASRCRCRGRRTRARPRTPPPRRCPRPRRRRRRAGGRRPPASIAASSERRVTSMSRFDSSSISPDGHGDRGVGVPALDDRPAVDREDVAVLEHDVVARDAVHDHVVRRRAHDRREPVVAEEVRARARAARARRGRRGRRRAWSHPGRAARVHTSCISATTAPGPPHERDLLAATCG